MEPEWRLISQKNDFIAKYKNLVLHVEEIDEGIWWWCVYTRDPQDHKKLWTLKASKIGGERTTEEKAKEAAFQIAEFFIKERECQNQKLETA